MNPEPTLPAGHENPMGAIFNTRGPSSDGSDGPRPAAGTDNHLQGLFTGQPHFVTPQTQSNPQPTPKYFIPNFQKSNDAANESARANPFAAETGPDKLIEDDFSKPKSATDDKVAVKDKDDKDKDKDKDKDGKKKDKDKDKDKNKKDKDDKNKNSKEKGKGEKDKESSEKEKDAKSEDTSDKEKESAEKKEGAKDEEVKLAPASAYDPLKDTTFLLSSGRPQEAFRVISGFLAKQPRNAQAHYICAVVLVALRDYSLAASEYNLVLQLVPGTPLCRLAIDGLHKINQPVKMPVIKLPPLKRP